MPGRSRMPAVWTPRTLAAVTVPAAVAAALGSLLAYWLRTPPTVIDLATAGCVLAATVLAHSARIRIAVRGGVAMATWGEAAVLVALYTLAPAVVPAVLLTGAVLAAALHGARARAWSTRRVLHTGANVSLAGAAAVLAAGVVTAPHHARLSLHLFLALLLAALVYAVVVTVLTGWGGALTTGARLRTLLATMFVGKLPMSVGNVAIGLVIVTLLGSDPGWLLVLPPVLWLMQQGYGYQLRVRDDRRRWSAFARVTGSLTGLDEAGVARAAVAGALELFGADLAELTVRDADGTGRGYRAGVPEPPAAAWPAPTGASRWAQRELRVGGAVVGRLRLRLPAGQQLSQAGALSLAAFADAVAAALHRAGRPAGDRGSRDRLTGLVDRAGFQEALAAALPASGQLGLVVLDLNRFREINDTLGHAAGDRLLAEAGARLSAAVQPGETLGRLGGDEFALLVPPAGDAPGGEGAEPLRGRARRRARTLLDTLATPSDLDGVQVVVDATAGLAVVEAGTGPGELLRRADVALHRAKREGADIAVYTELSPDPGVRRGAVLAELREALATPDQLVLLAQPICDLTTGDVLGVETLVRWRHPRRGLLGPAEFLSVVDASELAVPFTRHVLEAAVRVAAGWRAAGLDLPVGINLSAECLYREGLPGVLADLLERYAVPARQLVLEITETVVVPGRPGAETILAALRELGVGIAVNDFGTAHSSLTFLTRVTVDEIKIDRSFVGRMGDSPQAAAIVRTMIDLGQRLGMRVVAVGVETAEQAAELAALGCPAGQGYHLHPPLDPDQVPAVVGRGGPAAP
jgi:diguanylate cyclase (GGDEF)-like protein